MVFSRWANLDDRRWAKTEYRNHLRRVTEATAEQKSLLDLLGISFPDRLSFNRQCSVDSATARADSEGVAPVLTCAVTNLG